MTDQQLLRKRIQNPMLRWWLECQLRGREHTVVRIERRHEPHRVMKVTREDFNVAKAALLLLGHKL